MEAVACNLCGIENSEPLFRGRDRLLGGTQIFHSVRCRSCGLIYLNPRPDLDEIARYYPAEYEPFTRYKRVQSWAARLSYQRSMNKKCRIAAYGLKPGRLLDVGCGSGDFLLKMQQVGWEVYGLDLNAAACEEAGRRGLEVFQGQLFDLPYPDHSFDVLTMWDVLEHLHDPLSNLKRVAQLLKPGGRFTVTLPNPDGLDFRIFGRIWTGLDVPRHLYVFPRKTLMALFQKAGLDVVSSRCMTGGQRVSTWSLEWLIDEHISDPSHQRRLKKMIYTPVWYWAWRPFYFILDLFRGGSSITYKCTQSSSRTLEKG